MQYETVIWQNSNVLKKVICCNIIEIIQSTYYTTLQYSNKSQLALQDNRKKNYHVINKI